MPRQVANPEALDPAERRAISSRTACTSLSTAASGAKAPTTAKHGVRSTSSASDNEDAQGELDMDLYPDHLHGPSQSSKVDTAHAQIDECLPSKPQDSGGASVDPPRKRGRKPYPDAAQRRKAQNRAAQKSFRERKLAREKDLQFRAARYDELHTYATDQITMLSNECNMYRLANNTIAHDLQSVLGHASFEAPGKFASSGASLSPEEPALPCRRTSVASSSCSSDDRSLPFRSAEDCHVAPAALSEAAPATSQSSSPSTDWNCTNTSPFVSQNVLPTQPSKPPPPPPPAPQQTTTSPSRLPDLPQPTHLSEASPLMWMHQMLQGRVDGGVEEWLQLTRHDLTPSAPSSLAFHPTTASPCLIESSAPANNYIYAS